jgi:hypothetical protein
MHPARVILSENQTLSDRHEELLAAFLVRKEWEIVAIPPGGLKRADVNEFIRRYPPPTAIIFASYDPYLLAMFCRRTEQPIFLFHQNDEGCLDICLV